jgi:hypothetical protein
MLLRVLADLVVLVHLGFIVFVVIGGVLALRWPWMPWLHLPAVAWGALLELYGWTCPLTPLENWLRIRGSAAAYPGGFVDRYVLPLVYPAGLTRDGQVALGDLVCAVNVAVYLFVWRRRTAAARTT